MAYSKSNQVHNFITKFNKTHNIKIVRMVFPAQSYLETSNIVQPHHWKGIVDSKSRQT